MLPLIISREIGSISSTSFYEFVRSSRIKKLELSQNLDFTPTHEASINSCDLDISEERYLLSGSGNGTISIHDLHITPRVTRQKFEVVSKIDKSHKQKHSHAISRVQWYPHDTGAFTSSGMDKVIKIWDTNESCVVSEFLFPNHVNCHKMSKSLLLIAVACDNDKVQLLDLKSHSSTHKLSGHYRKPVLDVCWSPKNDYHLLSAGKDGKIILWDIRKARSCCFEFDRHNVQSSATSESVKTAHDGAINGVCFVPDGNHFLSFGTDNVVRFWNVESGKNMLCNYGRILNDAKKNVTVACMGSFAFIPSGKNVVVIDTFNGHQVKTLKGHADKVNCCIYKSDIGDLISGSNDRNILMWSYKGGVIDQVMKTDSRQLIANTSLTLDSWSDEER